MAEAKRLTLRDMSGLFKSSTMMSPPLGYSTAPGRSRQQPEQNIIALGELPPEPRYEDAKRQAVENAKRQAGATALPQTLNSARSWVRGRETPIGYA